MVSGAIVNSHAGSKNTLYELCDDLLVQAAKSGDGLAFTELARRHSTMIQRKPSGSQSRACSAGRER